MCNSDMLYGGWVQLDRMCSKPECDCSIKTLRCCLGSDRWCEDVCCCVSVVQSQCISADMWSFSVDSCESVNVYRLCIGQGNTGEVIASGKMVPSPKCGKSEIVLLCMGNIRTYVVSCVSLAI